MCESRDMHSKADPTAQAHSRLLPVSHRLTAHWPEQAPWVGLKSRRSPLAHHHVTMATVGMQDSIPESTDWGPVI